MIDPKTKMTFFHDDNGTFFDYTNAMVDLLRDPTALSITAAEDYVYLARSTGFGAVYVELSVPATGTVSLTAEYFDGTSWVALSIDDQTKGLTRSGFIFWERSLLQATTVNSVESCFVRLRPSTDISVTIVGANLVFSDDSCLTQEVFNITDACFLATGQTSHIASHVAARREIVERLIRVGYNDLDQWDFFDIFEVREAAMYLALAKIYFQLSESTEDQYWARYIVYTDKYKSSIQIPILNVDQNKDGVQDLDETNKQTRITRWAR